MIMFTERATYINVLKANTKPTLSVVHLGKIRQVSDVWTMSFSGRDWTYYTDLLDGSEKRQIIGMLDKLNSKITEPPDTMKNLRLLWNKIIGTSVYLTTSDK